MADILTVQMLADLADLGSKVQSQVSEVPEEEVSSVEWNDVLIQSILDLSSGAADYTDAAVVTINSALAGKANTGHTHTASNITDFNSVVASLSEPPLGSPPFNTGYFLTSTAGGLRSWVQIDFPTLEELLAAQVGGLIYGTTSGGGMWDVLGTGMASAGQVLTLIDVEGVGLIPNWETPAGGYPFLTNTDRGVFGIYDPTAVTGESSLYIREGADTTTYNPLFFLLNHAGDPVFQIGGVNNTWNLQTQGSMLDWFGQAWYLNHTLGVRVSADREYGISSTANSIYATSDVRFKRAAAGVATFLDDTGALCDLEIGAVYIYDGAVLKQVQFGADNTGPGGSGRALYIANA